MFSSMISSAMRGVSMLRCCAAITFTIFACVHIDQPHEDADTVLDATDDRMIHVDKTESIGERETFAATKTRNVNSINIVV